MRHVYAAVMVTAIVGLGGVLASRPPGSIDMLTTAAATRPTPPSEIAAATSPAAPSPEKIAANAPAAQTAPQAAAAHASGGGAQHAAAAPAPAGDVAAGRQVFRKCQACHSLEPGKSLVGPSLAGIVGKKAGMDGNFAYSPAMKQSGLTWDTVTLDRYLADPQGKVPGHRMPFPGLKSEHDRSDVIAFLAASSPPEGGAGGKPAEAAAAPQAPAAGTAPAMSDMSDVRYTLRSGIAEGRMVYFGVGG